MTTYPHPTQSWLIPGKQVIIESEPPSDIRLRVLCKAAALLLYSMAGVMKAFGKALEEFANG